MQMETVRESVFVAQEDMEHLDTRKIIPDGGGLQGSAEELSEAANGVNISWKWHSVEIHTKPEIGSELCPEIRIGAFGKGLKTCG